MSFAETTASFPSCYNFSAWPLPDDTGFTNLVQYSHLIWATLLFGNHTVFAGVPQGTLLGPCWGLSHSLDAEHESTLL